jgi:uncharacterized protein
VYSRPVDPPDHSQNPEAGGYGMFKLGDAEVGGVGPRPCEDQPPAWDRAAAVIARAKEAGGIVIAGPIDVLGEGTMGVLADPSGAGIGIWQPGRHRGWNAQDSGIPGVDHTRTAAS